MRLIDEAKGYATAANAEKKLSAVLGGNFDGVRWLIAVNSKGRFVPVVVGAQFAGLAHAGIAVVA